MPIASEISRFVVSKRCEMGLSQERLANLSGLTQSTLKEIETGTLPDLSMTIAERLLNVLGYGLGVTGIRKPRAGPEFPTALHTAARLSSTSYREQIPPETLREALLTGAAPGSYIPQLRVLLDESPLNILADAAAQIEAEHSVPCKTTWKCIRQLAAATACSREIWK